MQSFQDYEKDFTVLHVYNRYPLNSSLFNLRRLQPCKKTLEQMIWDLHLLVIMPLPTQKTFPAWQRPLRSDFKENRAFPTSLLLGYCPLHIIEGDWVEGGPSVHLTRVHHHIRQKAGKGELCIWCIYVNSCGTTEIWRRAKRPAFWEIVLVSFLYRSKSWVTYCHHRHRLHCCQQPQNVSHPYRMYWTNNLRSAEGPIT